MAKTIEIPIRLTTPNHSPRSWRGEASIRRKQKSITWLAMGPREPVEPPIVVTFTRIAPRQLDTDNLAFAFKAIRDTVAEWLGVDDSPKGGVDWRYAQERGQYGIRIEIGLS